MATPFNQGVPSIPVVLNTSNVFVFGNTASGNALSVQQLGTGNVATFRTTTGATALFVNATGNVGIGQTNPVFTLDTTGTARVTSNLVVGGQSTPTTPFWIQKNAASGISGTAQSAWRGQALLTDANGTQFLSIGSDQTNAVSFLQAYGAGVNKPLSLQPNGGNVGIGTTSPGAPLDVYKSTNSIFSANSDTTGVYPKVAVGTGGGFDRNAYLNVYGTESSAQTGLSSNHVMTITNFSGSYGYNNGDAPSSICFRQRWWSGGSGIEAVGGVRGIKTSTDGNTGGGVQLLYFNATLQPGLTLNNSGKVGIGTTSPATALQIGGTGVTGNVLQLGNFTFQMVSYQGLFGAGTVTYTPSNHGIFVAFFASDTMVFTSSGTPSGQYSAVTTYLNSASLTGNAGLGQLSLSTAVNGVLTATFKGTGDFMRVFRMAF
jgi:hypothetical protein